MSAVLDVVGRPVALSRHIVSLVEEGIEGFEDKGFVCDSLVRVISSSRFRLWFLWAKDSARLIEVSFR